MGTSTPGSWSPQDQLDGHRPGSHHLLTVTLAGLERLDTADTVILEVVGEIDKLTGPRLDEATREALDDADGRAVVIDLSQVTFLGLAGLHILLNAARAARRRSEPLRLVVDHARPVLRPLQLTGFDDVFTLYRTREEAIAGTTPPELPLA